MEGKTGSMRTPPFRDIRGTCRSEQRSSHACACTPPTKHIFFLCLVCNQQPVAEELSGQKDLRPPKGVRIENVKRDGRQREEKHESRSWEMC